MSTDAVSGYNKGPSVFSFTAIQFLTIVLAYQLKWSKSYTQSQCWQEEVKLLKEEMRWTLEFLKWRSSLWVVKTLKFDQSSSSPFHKGLAAYAFWQANIFLSLHNHFLSLWKGFRELNGTPNHLASAPTQTEEVMQGVEGGDGDLE